MFDYFKRLTRVKGKTLLMFILANALLILLVNALFRLPLWASLLENKMGFVFFGVFIYTCWMLALFRFFKHVNTTFGNLTLTTVHLKQGLKGAFLLILLLNALFLFFAHNIGKGYAAAPRFSGLAAAFQYIGILLFNILPGAFIEEITFRAFLLPQLYLVFSNRFSNAWVSLVSALLICSLLFSLCHIPRDLLRYDFDFSYFLNNSGQLFINSMVYSAIFLLSRNIWFAVFCHAFFNFSMVIIDSASSSGVFTLALGLVIACLWGKMFPVKPSL